MRLIIKELGDYTSTQSTTLKASDEFGLEGPYGQFNFNDDSRRQIWVGGGIGVSAFVARMKTLAELSDRRAVDLFHSTAVFDEGGIAKMRRDAQEAKVGLHIMVDDKDGFLTADRIFKTLPEWKSAGVWFCGPTGF